MSDRRVLEASESFAVLRTSGIPLMVTAGDRYWSDDPIVSSNPQLFRDLQVKSSVPVTPSTAQQTETATAAPGERRTPMHTTESRTPPPPEKRIMPSQSLAPKKVT